MGYLKEPDLLIQLEVVGLQVGHLPGQHAHLEGGGMEASGGIIPAAAAPEPSSPALHFLT